MYEHCARPPRGALVLTHDVPRGAPYADASRTPCWRPDAAMGRGERLRRFPRCGLTQGRWSGEGLGCGWHPEGNNRTSSEAAESSRRPRLFFGPPEVNSVPYDHAESVRPMLGRKGRG